MHMHTRRGIPSLVPACGERKSSILLYYGNKLFIFTYVRIAVCVYCYLCLIRQPSLPLQSRLANRMLIETFVM